LGINCRYNGKNEKNKKILKMTKHNTLIPVCPELFGGLGVPREAAVISKGSGKDVLKGKARVITKSGKDVTKFFLKGAKEVLRIVKLLKIKEAILKSNSPSCGNDGVLTALLKNNKIKVISEEEV
jgi:uncharacterized protein YbbK (DUF523 family)